MKDLLEISRELSAIGQAGISYSTDPYDRERFARILEVAGEVLQSSSPLRDFEWPAEVGYLTPKVDVRAVVFRGNEVLLIREAVSGLWTLPGGWADVNLSPAENAEKECREESGYEVKALKVTSLVDRDRAGYPSHLHAIYKIYFLCELRGGEARTSHESDEVRFFPIDHLPPLDPHRTQAEEIDRAWEHQQNPNLPTFFN